MIEYIYFVKCPHCEDEPFSFFDEAKEYALSCMSKNPIITQIEVNRNDFGECTDSCDLGTVWSWEDMVQEIEETPAQTVFTKDDLVAVDPNRDPEFDNLDDTLDCVPDNFRKPIPEGMTIEALIEEMEENEDTVECKWCNELFDKSECRYEVDLGYLCDRCEQAIKSRGETLTFREALVDDLTEASLSDVANAANAEFDTYYNEQDLLNMSGVEDEGFFDDLETPEEVGKELYAKRGMNAFGAKKSTLEELEEAADYNKRLTLCPECGTEFFDYETGICINCGFNAIED